MNNKELIEKLGINLNQYPEYVQQCLHVVNTQYGAELRTEIGFLFDEDNDLELIRSLSSYFPPIKLVTSKNILFDYRLKTGSEHIGFTHINPYYEDNIFYCIYAIPYQNN